MRINKFIASSTGISRRAADSAIAEGRVVVNGVLPTPGQAIEASDVVLLDGKPLALPATTTTIMLNKPVAYVCSRDGQGSRTIYDLLPPEFHSLKPVGRLDKDSSGLLLLTDDGELANELTHPRYSKEKVYEVTLGKPLSSEAQAQLSKGVPLNDGPSHLQINNLSEAKNIYKITMREGRNRQIRRTFFTLGYTVTKLHRTHFGAFNLDQLKAGHYLRLTQPPVAG